MLYTRKDVSLCQIVCGLVAAACSTTHEMWATDSSLSPHSQASPGPALQRGAGDRHCSAKRGPPGGSGSSTDVPQTALYPDLWKLWMTFSKQYFEKQCWGQRLKIKEQASVHPLIYICSTWKGTICSVDKNRQLLRGNVQLVSWAGSVVFVVELIHRQHGLQQGGFHTECQLMLQKFWHSVWS